MVIELMKKSRTHRFFTDKKILEEDVLAIIESARYAPFSMNAQNIRFSYVLNDDKCVEIFNNLTLGALIKEKASENERARAYILVLEDLSKKIPEKSLHFSMGACIQNMNLVANDMGYSSCIVAAYKKEIMEKIFAIDTEKYNSHYLIVLGEGLEDVVIDDVRIGESLKYYRENEVHHVPKLVLKDLIIK